MNPFTAAFSVLAVIAFIGLFIIVFDKGLKWKDRSE
jgi:preprotein translocase subunit SecE